MTWVENFVEINAKLRPDSYELGVFTSCGHEFCKSSTPMLFHES